MGGFTVIDGGAVAVVLVSALLAYFRGFIREAMGILGWIAAAIVAFFLAPSAEPLVREIPVVSDYLRDSCELSTLFAFAAVFAVTLAILSILALLLSSAIQRSGLDVIDRWAGFLFGTARGFLLVALALVVYDLVGFEGAIPAVDDSVTIKIFDDSKHLLSSEVTERGPGWLLDKYERLLGACGV